jgi:hypothetical protein
MEDLAAAAAALVVPFASTAVKEVLAVAMEMGSVILEIAAQVEEELGLAELFL